MLPSNSRYAVYSAGVDAKHQARERHSELSSKRRVDPATSVRNDCGEFTSFQISIRKGLEVQDDSLAMRTIRDLHELESVKGIWESWPGSRDSDLDFFCSIIWSRGSDRRPHVIVLTRNARPDAIP